MNEKHRNDAKLMKLAAEINNDLSKVVGSLRTTLAHARHAGDGLRKAKVESGHGKFTEWILQNITACCETCRRYMRLSEDWDPHVRAAVENNPNLTIEDALRLLRPESEKKGVITTPRLDIEVRNQLFRSFKQYINSLDDDAVSALHDLWDDIWADISVRLCGELGVSPDDLVDELKAAVLRKRCRRASGHSGSKNDDQEKR